MSGVAGADHGAAVGDGMVELFEREPDHRQIAFLDRAVVVAVERLAQHAVGRALHLRQLFRRFGLAHPGNQIEQIVAMLDVLLALVPLPVVLQPGAGRSEAGEHQNRAPDVVGIFFQEGALVAVDIGGRALMGGQRGVLVGVRLLDLRGARQFPRELLAHR